MVSSKRTMLDRGGGWWQKSDFGQTSLLDDTLWMTPNRLQVISKEGPYYIDYTYIYYIDYIYIYLLVGIIMFSISTVGHIDSGEL